MAASAHRRARPRGRGTTIYASAAGSAAAYYTKYLADSPGEIPGVWLGRQAASLGLAGDVSGDDLLAVLEGRDPTSGSLLAADESAYCTGGEFVVDGGVMAGP